MNSSFLYVINQSNSELNISNLKRFEWNDAKDVDTQFCLSSPQNKLDAFKANFVIEAYGKIGVFKEITFKAMCSYLGHNLVTTE